MPKSKHRRKPGGKAVAKPGRTQASQARAQALDGKMWRSVGEVFGTLMPAQRDVRGLPLFDHAANDKPVTLPSDRLRGQK
jgi:hypothetical protein